MAKALKTRASKQSYISPCQPTLVGFESPFTKNLNPSNRWVVLSHQMPWDTLVNVYQKQLNNSKTGADGINARVVIGSLIIKHMCDLSDRETVQQIQENIYMQYFIGYSSFSDEEPFDPSLFVEFRKRLGMEQINAINEKILRMSTEKKEEPVVEKDNSSPPPSAAVTEPSPVPAIATPAPVVITHAGKLIVDAGSMPARYQLSHRSEFTKRFPTEGRRTDRLFILPNKASEKAQNIPAKCKKGLS